MTGRVSIRFAKSLFDLAIEQGQLDAVMNDMKLIAETARENRDLVILFNSPVINTDKKKGILEEIFKAKISALTLAFINIILTKRREHYIPDIAADFVAMYKNKNGIQTATLTTAVAVDDENRAKIMALVKKHTGREVELKEQVDENLIGGFILRFGDNQIDTSIAGKIRELNKEFDKNLYVKEY